MIYTVTLNPAVDRELTVSAIEFDTVLRAIDWQVDCGGKGFNVSRMLMSLGTASTALGFAGGKSGELLRDGLTELGIATDFVWVDGETRTNVSIVTSSHDNHIKVNEPGPTISAESQQALKAKVTSLAQADDWWVLAGSLPPGVPDTFYAGLIAILKAAHANVVLDTSGTALQHGCEAGPTVVKPNSAELQMLTGLSVDDSAEIIAAANQVRQMGVANVIVSMGKDGALLVDDNGAQFVASPTIQERNPIGAGDSLVGGLVWALDQGHSMADALCWGIASGAATASLNGTTVGSRPLVEQLRSLVSRIY
jgi:1-phosphofructokinase family hexose kinase